MSELGVLLPCGSRVVHGAAADVRPAFPPETGIPGTIRFLSVGHAADARTPVFRGAMGYFPFDTGMRMPRHVHMTVPPSPPPAAAAAAAPSSDGGSTTTAEAGGADARGPRFVAEKVVAVSGVGLVELAGEVYVVPPLALVLIGPGVPHSWTACPAGVEVPGAGAGAGEGEGEGGGLVADGRFAAVFEYEDATAFFPTAQTRRLDSPADYVRENDLHAIRFPVMTAEEVRARAWFIDGTRIEKRSGEKIG
jgi:hypothetical protein